MTYIILSAMEEEVEAVIQKFEPKLVNAFNGQDVYYYNFENNDYYLSNTGIGKVNAAITTTLLINEYNPDLIISIGTSGGINEKLEITDLVVADKMIFHDVDVTGFGYKIGQLPNESQYLEVKYGKKFSDYLNNNNIDNYCGVIATGDKFVNNKKDSLELEEKFENLYAVEMESTAILMTSQHLNTECLVVRGISDLAHSDSSLEFDTYLSVVAKKFEVIVELLAGFNYER